MTNFAFRPYCKDDFHACIDIFDANCPEYLAPDERQVYAEFLEDSPKGYEVCKLYGRVIGGFGLSGESTIEKRLDWIMVGKKTQGMGVGETIMKRVIYLARKSKTRTIGFATSQKVAPFFEKYGATTISITRGGYGMGIDRVDMVLPL